MSELDKAIIFVTKDLEKAKMLDMSVHTDVESVEKILSTIEKLRDKANKDITDRIDMLHLELKGKITDKYYEGKLIGEVRGLKFIQKYLEIIGG